jgi:gas vesicle protein
MIRVHFSVEVKKGGIVIMYNDTTTTTTAEPVFTHSDYQTRDTSDSQKGTGSRFTTGLVLGGLVGAAAALLYAPKKGNEMRESLRESSLKLKDRTLQMKDETMLKAQLGKMEAKDKVESMKDKKSNMNFSARQKLQEAKNTVEEVKEDAKSAIEEAKKEAEREGYGTESNSKTTAVVTPRTMSSADSQKKTGTDTSFEKKQSDVNNSF